MNMFERATRERFRFDTPNGRLTVEDLWDLPLEARNGRNQANLDDIAKALFKSLQSGDDKSFVRPEAKSDPTIQAKFDIAKYIIDVKLDEAKKATEARARREAKSRLREILLRKKNEAQEAKSIEEIEKELAELDAVD